MLRSSTEIEKYIKKFNKEIMSPTHRNIKNGGKCWVNDGIIWASVWRGEGTNYLPMFYVAMPVFHKKRLTDMGMLDKAKKLIKTTDIDSPLEYDEFKKALKKIFKELPGEAFVTINDTDKVKPIVYPDTATVLKCNADLVTARDVFKLSNRVNKDTWNKIKGYFFYYNGQPSDDYDPMFGNEKGWFTYDNKSVIEILKK